MFKLSKLLVILDCVTQSKINTFYLLGLGVFVLRIVVPVVLLIFGIIDLIKVITSGSDKDMKPTIKRLEIKFVLAALVFLLPTFVSILLNITSSEDDKVSIEGVCVLHAISPECRDKVNFNYISDPGACIETSIYDVPYIESSNTTSSSNSGHSSSGSSGGSSVDLGKPTPIPITEKVNIDAVNRAIGNAVKSNGYHTRGAVVAAAKTLINELKKYDYQVPYQSGGMYHRDNKWGINPAWGTIILHNGKNLRAGLDCRNFVNWVFKQGGISLCRGYGIEGGVNREGNPYSNFGDGRPGDVIDSPQHIMLIVENNKASQQYVVAQSMGGHGVVLTTYKYSDLQPQVVKGVKIMYKAYNMDGAYNNNGYWCTDPEPNAEGHSPTYRPYAGSCHIPVSNFPSYYK